MPPSVVAWALRASRAREHGARAQRDSGGVRSLRRVRDAQLRAHGGHTEGTRRARGAVRPATAARLARPARARSTRRGRTRSARPQPPTSQRSQRSQQTPSSTPSPTRLTRLAPDSGRPTVPSSLAHGLNAVRRAQRAMVARGSPRCQACRARPRLSSVRAARSSVSAIQRAIANELWPTSHGQRPAGYVWPAGWRSASAALVPHPSPSRATTESCAACALRATTVLAYLRACRLRVCCLRQVAAESRTSATAVTSASASAASVKLATTEKESWLACAAAARCALRSSRAALLDMYMPAAASDYFYTHHRSSALSRSYVIGLFSGWGVSS